MSDMSLYELPYDEQPEDVWIECPWSGDPEVSETKKGDYAKKCPCQNCIGHTYTDDPESYNGRVNRFIAWIRGVDLDLCRICSVYNDCTRESADCGWMGGVAKISIQDGNVVTEMHDKGDSS